MHAIRARKGKPWRQTSIHLRATAPVLDPTRRGLLGNVAYGGSRNPYRNRKGGYGHSPPAGCARPGSTRRESPDDPAGCFGLHTPNRNSRGVGLWEQPDNACSTSLLGGRRVCRLADFHPLVRPRPYPGKRSTVSRRRKRSSSSAEKPVNHGSFLQRLPC